MNWWVLSDLRCLIHPFLLYCSHAMLKLGSLHAGHLARLHSEHLAWILPIVRNPNLCMVWNTHTPLSFHSALSSTWESEHRTLSQRDSVMSNCLALELCYPPQYVGPTAPLQQEKQVLSSTYMHSFQSNMSMAKRLCTKSFGILAFDI